MQVINLSSVWARSLGAPVRWPTFTVVYAKPKAIGFY